MFAQPRISSDGQFQQSSLFSLPSCPCAPTCLRGVFCFFCFLSTFRNGEIFKDSSSSFVPTPFMGGVESCCETARAGEQPFMMKKEPESSRPDPSSSGLYTSSQRKVAFGKGAAVPQAPKVTAYSGCLCSPLRELWNVLVLILILPSLS